MSLMLKYIRMGKMCRYSTHNDAHAHIF